METLNNHAPSGSTYLFSPYTGVAPRVGGGGGGGGRGGGGGGGGGGVLAHTRRKFRK